MKTSTQIRMVAWIGALLISITTLVLMILFTRADLASPTFSHTLRFTRTNHLERTTFIIIPVTHDQWRGLTNRYPAHVVAGEVNFK